MQRGRRQPRQHRHLLVGAARAARGEFDFGWLDGFSSCCTTAASGRPRHPDRVAARLVLRDATRVAGGHPRRVAGSGPARAAWAARARPSTPRPPPASPPRSPSATARTRRSRCGTCTTSTALPLRNDTATVARLPRAGCRPATARSTRSTPPGARRSGASATATWTRSAPRQRPRRSSTRRSGSTSPVHRPRAARVLPAASATSCGLLARHAGHHQLHGDELPVRRPVGLGARGRHRLERPLPHGGARRPPRAAGPGRRPHPLARRRPAVDPHGALHLGRQLAAAQHRQAPRRAAPQLPDAPRARCGRGSVLPVAGLPLRRREVPLGDAAARGHRQ